MNVRDLSRRAGIAVSLLSVVVLVAPYAVVAGYGSQVGGYYAAGAFGAGAVALFALLNAVVLASVEQGNVDPGTLVGVAAVLGVATVGLAAVWFLAIEPTTMFNDYRWLRWHAPAVVAVTLPMPAFAGLYAREILS